MLIPLPHDCIPVGIQIDLSVAERFDISTDLLGADGKLETGESGFIKNYTGEQKAIINAYKENTGISSDTYYIFYTGLAPSQDEIGFMPLSRRYGFVFSGGSARTIAHELAHGAFKLEHPWSDNKVNIPKEKTSGWLMDYLQQTKLPHHHWRRINDPALRLYVFQDEEEGEAFNQYMSEESIKQLITTIRNDNISKEDYTDLSFFQLSRGVMFDLELSSDVSLDFISVDVKSGRPISNQIMTQFEPLIIKPSEIVEEEIPTPPGLEGKFSRIHFSLYERILPTQNSYQKSDSIAVEFIVRKEHAVEFKEYLLGLIKPKKGDPLIEMRIVHTNNSPNSGGMFGCARGGTGCDNSSIPNLPKYTDKKKVHDGIDLYAPLNTNIFSMFKGTITKIVSTVSPNTQGAQGSFGNRVRIKSEAGQHNFGNLTIYVYYTHLNRVEDGLTVGEKVNQSQKIGESGKTGNAYNISSTRYHTHICIYINGVNSINKVNSLDYFTTKFDANGNKIED